MKRNNKTSVSGTSEENQTVQPDRTSFNETKWIRPRPGIAKHRPGYKLLLIKKLNPAKLDAQLEKLLGKDFTGDAIILDNHNNIYYVRNGVLENKEKIGHDQKSEVPLTVKIADRNQIKLCSSFRHVLEDVSHLPGAKKIIDEAILTQKELPTRMILIETTENRLRRIKYLFKMKLYESILKTETPSGLKLERHPFVDLQNYERAAIFEILYKEKVEEIISSDKEFGVINAEEYKLKNSPLSNAPLWFYDDVKDVNPHTIYNANQERIKKQLISLLNPNGHDYSKKFSHLFLRYLESYYKAEIRHYIYDNDLASAVALYHELKQLPLFFSEKFLTEISLMIDAAAEKVKDYSIELDPRILSNIKLIQEKIDVLKKADSILDNFISESKNFQKKLITLQEAISANNFITPEIKANAYDHLSNQEIIFELIFAIGMLVNYQHLNNKSKAQTDECTYRIYLLFSRIKEIGPWLVEEEIRANKENLLTAVEEKIEELFYQKNQLTRDFYQCMNSYVVKNQINQIPHKSGKKAVTQTANLTVPEKKSLPPAKPNLHIAVAPIPSLTFVETIVKIFWSLVNHLSSTKKKREQSPLIQARVHGTHAVHYVITKKTPPVAATHQKSSKPTSSSRQFFKCAEHATMPNGKNHKHSPSKPADAIDPASRADHSKRGDNNLSH